MSRNVQQPDLWASQGTPIPAEGERFRPIHYLGSKLRLVDKIAEVVNQLVPLGSPVCDLFSGSGTVSAALRHSHQVTAVDIQEYARVLSSAVLHGGIISTAEVQDLVSGSGVVRFRALVEKVVAPLVEVEDQALREASAGDVSLLEALLHAGPLIITDGDSSRGINSSLRKVRGAAARALERAELSGAGTVISRYYGGVYFSYRQAANIDVLLHAAFSRSGLERDTVLASVLGAASEVVNTVGKQFAQPISIQTRSGTKKPHNVRKILRDRSLDVVAQFYRFVDLYEKRPGAMYPHRSVRQDFGEFLRTWSESAALYYADPPYTRDHYSRYYHVLETMALRDAPLVSASNLRSGLPVSRGVYRADRHQSPFCVKSQAGGAFSTLFEGVSRRDASLLLSYSPFVEGGHPRLLTLESVERLARRYFSKVEVIGAGPFAHSKLNRSDKSLDASPEAEVLISCLP